jgi:tetratricopeptide (TPR) repeat protein/TolB-like protein
MEVLVCLAARGREVAGKQELLAEVWPDTFVSDHVLTHVVWQLRKALGSADLVETIPRRGYRLTVDPGPAPPAFMEGTQRPAPDAGRTPSPAGTRWFRGRPVRWLAATGVAMLFLGAAYWIGESGTSGAGLPIRRLLVPPLEVAASGETQQALVDGVDACLRQRLLELHALQLVGSRWPAPLYAGASRKPPGQLAREAGADAVALGTAAIVDGRVRITLEVRGVRGDRVLLARTFDRDLHDLLSLCDEVVRAVAGAGGVPVGDGEARRLSGRRIQAQAAREYLVGLGLAKRGGARDKALGHYRRAIELEPEFVPALTSAAQLLTTIRSHASAPEAARLAEEARALALRAVQLDPASAPAAAALGLVEGSLFWNWPEAGRRFADAERLRPDDPALVPAYANFLAWTGQCDRALAVVRREKSIDPLSNYPVFHEHWVHYMCGEFEAAIEDGRAALALDPSAAFVHTHMGFALALLGRHPEALAECAKSFPDGSCQDPFVLGKAGRGPEARAILERWGREGPDAFLMAVGFAGLDDRDRVFEWLAKGYERRDPNMRFLLDRAFSSLRGDPRYRDLACKMDLPPGECASAPQ